MAPEAAVVEWAIANSDPANLVALGAVYWQLRKEHRALREQVVENTDEIDEHH